MARRKLPGTKAMSPQERREQAQAARAKDLAKFKQAAARRAVQLEEAERERASIPQRDSSNYLAAARQIPLRQVASSSTLRISEPYRRLIEKAVGVMNRQEPEAVLCWPSCDPSPAGLAALLAMVDCGSCEPIKVNSHDALTQPTGLRALVYPYARTGHRALRHLYVDKDYFGGLHFKHQLRNYNRDADAVFDDYHKVLARARKLTGIASDGNRYEELAHPCLDETIPSGPCLGNGGKSDVLWRIGNKTDLPDIARTGQADDPAEARFYLFGLRADENVHAALRNVPGRLDIVLLDMDATGRHRLGRDWVRKSREFVTALKARQASVPVLALTDDPWACDALRFDVLGVKAAKKTKRPAASSVVYFPRSDIAVAEDSQPPSYAKVQEWEIHGFSGAVEEIFIRLRAAIRKSYQIGDGASAESLRELSARLRRCVSLPGSLVQLSEFCCGEVESDVAAASILSGYRIEPVVRELRESTNAFSQLHGGELREICSTAERAAQNTLKLTSMGPLLRDCVKENLGKSSRTIVIAPNDMIADFAVHALERDEEIGVKFGEKVDKEMLAFCDRSGLSDFDAVPQAKRNEYKRAIIFSPSRSALLRILSRGWLPEKVIVLADCDTLRGAAQDTGRLAGLPELGDLEERMRGFSEHAARTVEEIAHTTVSFGVSEEPEDDLMFPRGGVVNLAGNVRAGQSVLHFKFADGQALIARPGTRLVVQDRTRALPTFSEMEARNVSIGEHVCVIGDAFLEMARPLLNISVRAAEEIRDYHARVLERFAQVSGSSEAEKLALVVEKMGMPEVSVQRASYWINLRDQIDAHLHEVIPHAPRDWITFAAFMKALGIGDVLAARFWTWAVIAQRASRHRAAINFHEAYRGILVDAYAAQSDNPERAGEIRSLRAAAENFVSVVRARTEEKIGS